MEVKQKVFANNFLLDKWSTDVGMTVLGIICGGIAGGIINFMIEYSSIIISLIIFIAYFTIAIYYMLKIYPSYFGDNPKVKSSENVSFLNGLFSGIIFGCLWNSSLTEKKIGISHIVSVVLIGVGFLIGIFLNFAIAMGGGYY